MNCCGGRVTIEWHGGNVAPKTSGTMLACFMRALPTGSAGFDSANVVADPQFALLLESPRGKTATKAVIGSFHAESRDKLSQRLSMDVRDVFRILDSLGIGLVSMHGVRVVTCSHVGW